MSTLKKQNEKECCPTFNIIKWNEKTFNWDKKNFIKASVPALFHIPPKKKLGKKIMQLMKQAEDAHSISENKEDVLLLFNDPHPFRSDMYLSVEEPVVATKNVQLSGKFRTKVFDGPPNAMPKYIKEMNTYLANQNEEAKEYYVHYGCCPKCAEEKGHNYMVLFAEV